MPSNLCHCALSPYRCKVMPNMLFYVDIVHNIVSFEYIANTETFDFVSNARPNIGFGFVLA